MRRRLFRRKHAQALLLLPLVLLLFTQARTTESRILSLTVAVTACFDIDLIRGFVGVFGIRRLSVRGRTGNEVDRGRSLREEINWWRGEMGLMIMIVAWEDDLPVVGTDEMNKHHGEHDSEDQEAAISTWYKHFVYF